MAKVLVSMDDGLLARLDRAARDLGLSRSGYLARLAARELNEGSGKKGDVRVAHALDRIDRLSATYGVTGDATEAVRRQRDAR